MAQLQKGTTYITGDQVTAANLNALVDSGTLIAGAITDQTAKTVPLAADTILLHSAADTALRKTTMTQLFATPQPLGATTPSSVAATTGTFSSTLGVTGVATLGNGAILGTPASGNLASCTGYVGTSALVTVGALNSGSITSGFGSIDVGADAISGGAGAFSTLSATGTISSTVGNAGTAFDSQSATTGYIHGVHIKNTSGELYLGLEGTTAGTLITGDSAYDTTVRSLTPISFSANGGSALHARISTTGLAVTGNLTSSGYLSGTNIVEDTGAGTTDGVTSNGAELNISRSSNAMLNLRRRSSDGAIVLFRRDTTQVGTISVTTTATAYNTSSDARLKTNVRELTGSGAVIDSLQPRIFDWKTGEKDTYGFIAQEAFTAFPQAVTKGDDDPEVVTQQWAIDASKFMPLAIAELQSLRKRLAALESK